MYTSKAYTAKNSGEAKKQKQTKTNSGHVINS